jgi:hypothetical protein
MLVVLRKLLILVSVLSAVTCLLVSVFWIRSIGTADFWYYSTARFDPDSVSVNGSSVRGSLSIEIRKVELWVFRLKIGGIKPPTDEWEWRNIRHLPELASVRWREFGYRSGKEGETWSFHVTVPHWLAVGLSGLMPTIYLPRAIRSIRGQRRQRAGRCVACGYDLRATPERCPECGTVSSKKAALVPSPSGRSIG